MKTGDRVQVIGPPPASWGTPVGTVGVVLAVWPPVQGVVAGDSTLSDSLVEVDVGHWDGPSIIPSYRLRVLE